METVGQLEAGFWELLEAFQSVSVELGRFKEVPQIAQAALQLALDLTRSSVAFIVLDSDSGGRRQYSLNADGSGHPDADAIERMAAAAASPGPGPNPMEPSADLFGQPRLASLRSICSQQLRAGEKVLGAIGVASSASYSSVQRRAFAVFANQVAASVEIAQLQERRQEMVDALVNLRADLDRSEHERLVNEERAQAAERVERAHQAEVAALVAVSVHARSGPTLDDFYRRLTTGVAELVGASKVLFWQLNEDGTLTAIPGAHGVDGAFMARLYPARCTPDNDDLTSRIVFHDQSFRASRTDESPEHTHVLDALGVADAISVAWRAGDQRLGLVAAYDSIKTSGFSREDTWVLQKIGLAAGLVWQLKLAERDLTKTVERLQKVDAARQLLLKNVSTAVDKARRRLASELHDDALQKLTAAELQVQRLGEASGDGPELLEGILPLLAQTEDALRRLLFEVRPPALEIPGGFEETIRDRVAMLRSMTGIEAELDLNLPDELPYEFKSLVFRQVAEALTNIERHASATQVEVSVKQINGAVHGLVVDNGRGFVVSERDHLPGHLGLLALNERSLLAGGWTKIESEPGLGTRVEFWMPTA
ncbi:MAG: sensor histidine kinase [Candidatus Dormibacteraceae bacterium]